MGAIALYLWLVHEADGTQSGAAQGHRLLWPHEIPTYCTSYVLNYIAGGQGARAGQGQLGEQPEPAATGGGATKLEQRAAFARQDDALIVVLSYLLPLVPRPERGHPRS